MNAVVIATGMGIHPLLPLSLASGADIVLIESALVTASNQARELPEGKQTVTVVVSRDSPIPAVLKARGWAYLQFVEQPGKYGVPDAIARGALARLDGKEPLLVLFADELYLGDFSDNATTMPYYNGSTSKNRDYSWITMKNDDARSGMVDESISNFLERFKITVRRGKRQSKNLGDIKSFIDHLQGTV